MNKNKQIKTKTATPTIKTIKMTKAIITKMTINNYQNSNNNNNNKKKYIYIYITEVPVFIY